MGFRDRVVDNRLSLTRLFMLGSLVILATGMAAVGVWVARLIEDDLVRRTATATALYVDSLIAWPLQSLATGESLTPEAVARLDRLLQDSALRKEIALFHVWDRNGVNVYSTMPEAVGQRFPLATELADALAGRVSGEIEYQQGAVNPGNAPRRDLIEIYSPVRNLETGDIIAVAEFYYGAEDLRDAVDAAQRRSWLLVGGATLVIYLLLAAFVQRASNTIARQQRALGDQVARLTELLRQNEEMHRRVRGAAARTTALNERFLRRFSAELHDGPAQDISLALLRLDHVTARCAAVADPVARAVMEEELRTIESSLRRALQEVRATSYDLLLPQLAGLTVTQTVERAVRAHRRRSGQTPDVAMRSVPPEAPVSVKIALYRIVQEALANAWRHAGGADVGIVVDAPDHRLRVEVADRGPGFDVATIGGTDGHLGLLGMRERVESLGGEFAIKSAPGAGTRLVATLPLVPDGGSHD